jgi:SagB-type dehydrogenase family enzyme
VLSFRSDISVVEEPDGRVALESPSGRALLSNVTGGLLEALRRLGSIGATEDELIDLIQEADGTHTLAWLYYHLQRFRDLGLLCYSVKLNGVSLASVVPMVRGYDPSARTLPLEARCRLSRFAYVRRDGETLVLESPLSSARTMLPGAIGATLVGALARTSTCRELCTSLNGVPEATARALLDLLASAGTIAEVGDDGALAEDADPALRQWEFHDLLFHSRSRAGRHSYPVGGTFRFLDTIPALPAIRPNAPNVSGEVIPLFRPDLDALAGEDPPFTRVLESRTSLREYGRSPITVRQLGEFLYRVARVRTVVEPDAAGGLLYQATSRPYPSGGAAYDLELYVTVNACAGVPEGLYHYDPLDHQLRKRAERTVEVEKMLRDARAAAPLQCDTQILITLASRFQRLSWKYNAIAYATALKNVGVLYQTMYLVATAMRLAPCALGSGDSDVFAAAAGTDYYVESSVGEFLLGSAPPTD